LLWFCLFHCLTLRHFLTSSDDCFCYLEYNQIIIEQMKPNINKNLFAWSRIHVTGIIVGWLLSSSELVEPPTAGSKPGEKYFFGSASKQRQSYASWPLAEVPLSRQITT
jgi:hypothetical protein